MAKAVTCKNYLGNYFVRLIVYNLEAIALFCVHMAIEIVLPNYLFNKIHQSSDILYLITIVTQVRFVVKGCRMGRPVALIRFLFLYVALLINTRFRYFILE